MKIEFKDLKLNSDGLIPAIAQDYITGEVLMLAYMDEEAYKKTLETLQAHYHSRSRSKLWHKGEESGHFQNVKSLVIDCDNDTILLKVQQVGVACHTGAYSCFYRVIEHNGIQSDEINELVGSDKKDVRSNAILKELYNVILDRKANPKEGSYTNYLFDKGIDKILKKVGEETAEVIIASKNLNKDEIKYEVSDLYYHLFVLMVQTGVELEDIYEELSKRR